MGAEEKISVTLSEELTSVVRQAVDSGGYSSPEAVVAAALQYWQNQRERDVAKLREMVEEGIASGFEPHDGVESIKQAGRRRLAAREE